ncbi:MAG: membrane protein insertase YidC [Nitrospirota bacterium]|nr:membrane protein insertase YidC [Nitrospirota bacterium]
MDNKRYILAIGLSMMVLMVYMRFFAPQPVETPPAAEQQTAAADKAAEPAAAAPRAAPASVARKIAVASSGKDIVIETDVLKAVVNTAGGVITQWELKHFREADKTEVGIMPLFHRLTGGQTQEPKPAKDLGNVHLFTRYDGVNREDVTAPLTIIPTEKALDKLGAVEFRASASSLKLDKDKPEATLTLSYAGPGGISVEKKLTFHYNTYRVDVEVLTRGLDGYTLSLGTDFGMTDKISSNASGRVGVSAFVDGKVNAEKFESIKGELQYSGTVDWFGQHDKYFTATILSGAPGIVTTKRTSAPKEVGDLVTTSLLVKDKPGSRTFTLYAGPMSFNDLKAYGKGLEQLVDYGWFGVLARPMFWLMNWFYAFAGNYGIAIILLTIVVRALLFYPSLKSATAMEEMKALQPEMNAIREKYKKDPQKMNQEIMRLYKEHKVNPMGGCLPMLLQLPFFVALYNVLSVSIELRQAPFLSFWIKDLSVHDPFYILPILMGVSMVATMQMTSTSIDPQQKKMMMFMNIAFIFLFAWLPAGLLLYITLSNVLSIVQQLYVRKLIAAEK